MYNASDVGFECSKKILHEKYSKRKLESQYKINENHLLLHYIMLIRILS